MEDVLEVYHRPYDDQRPVVCVDETGRQLIGESRIPVPPEPGRTEKFDHEHVRNGTANLFMMFEPMGGWRHVKVTDRRTAVDFAGALRDLSDVHYPDAERIVLVCDNLNTHDPSCLYAAFPPEEARRLAERFEWHHTPRHGSWLNMAEIELAVLQRQRLDRRIATKPALEREVAARETPRNRTAHAADWRFTTADARIRLKRLYPKIQA